LCGIAAVLFVPDVGFDRLLRSASATTISLHSPAGEILVSLGILPLCTTAPI